MENHKIGQRIKMLRKSQGLTQEQLSELINVSPHYIYEIESGLKQMSLDTFKSIVSTLNTSADYLLFGNERDSISELVIELSESEKQIVKKFILSIYQMLMLK